MKNLFSKQKRIFFLISMSLVFLALIFVLIGSEGDDQYYQEVRESRMGLLEKVRRGKSQGEHAEISQHREGVSRMVLRSSADGVGEKLLFALSARAAYVTIKMATEAVGIAEEFHHARGILQEELYFLLKGAQNKAATKLFSRISKDGLTYVDESEKEVLLSPEEQKLLSPLQLIRTFVAEEVLWDLDHDIITAYACDFATYVLPGHIIPEDLFERTPDSQGRADQLRVRLKVDEKERVTAEGVKMTIGRGVLPW